MNRSGNPPEPADPRHSGFRLTIAAFGPVLLVPALALLLGRGSGPGLLIGMLVWMPLAGLAMDAWTLAAARRFRSRGNHVTIPCAGPVLFAGARIALHGLGRALASRPADSAASSGPTSPDTGWLVATGAGALLSLAFAIHEGIVLRVALNPGLPRGRPGPATREDFPVGREYAYEAQTILQALGYYAGPMDSALSDEMREALLRFQREVGLAARGELTAATVIELRRRWEEYQATGRRHEARDNREGGGKGSQAIEGFGFDR
jgi:hypothetical protein